MLVPGSLSAITTCATARGANIVTIETAKIAFSSLALMLDHVSASATVLSALIELLSVQGHRGYVGLALRLRIRKVVRRARRLVLVFDWSFLGRWGWGSLWYMIDG